MRVISSLFAMAVLTASAAWAAPEDCTQRPIRVQGGSMAPRIANGALINVEIGTKGSAH